MYSKISYIRQCRPLCKLIFPWPPFIASALLNVNDLLTPTLSTFARGIVYTRDSLELSTPDKMLKSPSNP